MMPKEHDSYIYVVLHRKLAVGAIEYTRSIMIVYDKTEINKRALNK